MTTGRAEFNESPFELYVGEAFDFSYEWPDTVTNPVTALYKDDAVYETILSGSESSSGASQTSRVVTPVDADHGQELVFVMQATFNGRTEIKFAFLNIIHPKTLAGE